MYRSIVLFQATPDREWYERHLELARKVPGATVRSGRIFGSPSGEPDFQHYAEFEFSDRESFKEGVNSREMMDTVEDVERSGHRIKVYFLAFE